MKKILITNDDGIDSNGIVRLAKAAKKFGEVWVVAPESQRSASSHSITLRHSIEAWPYDFPVEGVHAFACDGQPADCIRIGVLNIVPDKPDVVFSGINYGYNVASDLQYSATAGAAFEAVFQKIPSIAFSEDFSDMHETTDAYLEQMIEEHIDAPFVEGEIININFPGCTLSELKGIQYDSKVSNGAYFTDIYLEDTLENGHTSYTVKGIRQFEAKEGTDFYAMLNNYISVGRVSNLQ